MIIDDTANYKTNDTNTLKFKNTNLPLQVKSEERKNLLLPKLLVLNRSAHQMLHMFAQIVRCSSKSTQSKHKQSTTLKIGDRVMSYCPILGLTFIGCLTIVSKSTTSNHFRGITHTCCTMMKITGYNCLKYFKQK